MKTPAAWVAEIGPTINAQFTITWDTSQTMDAYLDILDDRHFDIDEFIEYVKNNALETITQLTQLELDSYLALVAGDGELI
jgi:hypothetical protein